MIIMKEKNMGWGCDCTNLHACYTHKTNSFYKGSDDYGTLPIPFKLIKNIELVDPFQLPKSTWYGEDEK